MLSFFKSSKFIKFIQPINVNNQYIKYRLPSLKSDIYLIKWLPRKSTEYHGHYGKICDFILFKGKNLKEFRKNKHSEVTLQNIEPFKKYTINDLVGTHKIMNIHNTIKWSLHRYY